MGKAVRFSALPIGSVGSKKDPGVGEGVFLLNIPDDVGVFERRE